MTPELPSAEKVGPFLHMKNRSILRFKDDNERTCESTNFHGEDVAAVSVALSSLSVPLDVTLAPPPLCPLSTIGE